MPLQPAFTRLSPVPPDPSRISGDDIADMLEAGKEVKACMQALERVGLNLVGEVLKGQGTFVELEHYPKDDVFDEATYSQYYYHAHRSETGEHGHFHTFLRAGGMPPRTHPLDDPLVSECWPRGDEAIAHLVGISMDAWGRPIGLFAVNRWVTGETWHPAASVIEMLPRFEIAHAWPSWPLNRWISAMLRLFRPQIHRLLHHRDAVIDAWRKTLPSQDILEHRGLELTGYLPISVDGWIASLERWTP